MNDSIESTNIESMEADTTDAAPTDDAATDTEHTETEPKASREAARYRRQLREAQGELESLKGQLEALRRAEVGRIVEAAKLKPEAVWAAGTDLANLLAEDGTVDAAKVAEAIKVTREVFGINPLPPAPPAWGQGNVGSPIGPAEPQKTWNDVLRSR